MDAESPIHLERLRACPEYKVAMLRMGLAASKDQVRFDRAPGNTSYWPPLLALLDRLQQAGAPAEVREPIEIYERPCLLIATSLTPSPIAPCALAVVAADGEHVEVLAERLRDVCHDYWYGSYFWK